MCYESTVRWARHLYLAVSMQRVRIMHHSHLKLHSESRFYVVDDSIPLLLLLQLKCKIRGQIHQAREHMNLNQPHFSGPLTERLDYLSCYEALRKVELDVEVLKSNTQFLVRVGEIREERYVTIEELRGVEVDDAEARRRGVERRASRFESDEYYERDDAEEDEQEAEEKAQDGTEPHDWIRSPRWSKDGWLLSGCNLVAVGEC